MFDVTHIAKLARLGLGEEEKEKFARELAAILEFVAKLKEVDTENVEPTSQVTGLRDVTRSDEARKGDEKCRKQILANAPSKKDDYVKVKPVFE